ncbi:MAG: formate dehydrogenase accessory sulfurtransferase FdhD [Candidatus Limnocylindrus sp.]
MSGTPDPQRRTALRRVRTWRDGVARERDDTLTGEEPAQISVVDADGVRIDVAVTMRTPGQDEELAVGFLVSESLIVQTSVARVTFGDPLDASQPENHISVHVKGPFDAARVPTRTTVATASCGICGKASIDDVVQRLGRVQSIMRISDVALLKLPAQLRDAQAIFGETGGIHAAATVAVAPSGALTISVVREDVGRHNAVDKLIGEAALRLALPLSGALLLLSGRCSFELVQKAAAAGYGAIACVGAPSSLAVETAERLGICLIGFLREGSFNVYTQFDVVQP